MHSRALIIVENPNQIKKLISLARTSGDQETRLRIVALNGAVSQELSGENLNCRTPEDYGLTEEWLQSKAGEWYRSFPNCEVKDNKNIKQLLTYNGISLWWLIEQQLYCSQFSFPKVMRIIMQTIMLNHIIEFEKPTTVYCAGCSIPVSRITESISRLKNIAIIPLNSSSSIKTRLIQQLEAEVYISGLWFRMLLRKMCWMILNRKRVPVISPGKKKLLAFSSSTWANVCDLKSGKTKKGDPYLDSMFELFEGEKQIVSVDVPTEDWGLTLMKDKARQRQITYKPFEGFLDIGIMLRAFRASRRLHRDYRRLADNEKFRKSLYLQNIPLYDLLKPNLSLFFSRGYLALIVTIIEIAKRIIEIEAPDTVIHYADLPDTGRAVIASAREKGIPVLLLQHGLYDSYCHYFSHVKSDIGPNKEADAPYCPVPDKYALSDSHTKDILARYGAFSAEDAIVTGQPRYDVIAKANELFDRLEILGRLNLDPKKKVVSWMTASHAFSSKKNEQHISSVYQAMTPLSDAQLIVKLHPGENQRAPLYRKNNTICPTITGQHGPTTFELLSVSDVVITNGYCSTAIEAIMLDKPVVMIDFSDNLIPPYVECGAAIGVHEADTLASVVENALYDEKTRQKLAKARKQFVSDFGCKTDGKASQRVADILGKMGRR